MKRYKEDQIDELVEILKNDGVISAPTDTVYGICAQVNSKIAFDKLVKIKKRPATKSFPVMCCNIEQIRDIGIVDEKVEKLIEAFMPGPITLVLNKKSEAFLNNAGLRETDELAVRMAPTKALNELITKLERPIFMTSANHSGKEVCTSLENIEKEFPELAGILEGDVSFGEASTIVDCTKDEIKIQRERPITEEEIRKVLKG